jgi:hypothetical protein
MKINAMVYQRLWEKMTYQRFPRGGELGLMGQCIYICWENRPVMDPLEGKA